jgi:hypothetical protein
MYYDTSFLSPLKPRIDSVLNTAAICITGTMLSEFSRATPLPPIRICLIIECRLHPVGERSVQRYRTSSVHPSLQQATQHTSNLFKLQLQLLHKRLQTLHRTVENALSLHNNPPFHRSLVAGMDRYDRSRNIGGRRASRRIGWRSDHGGADVVAAQRREQVSPHHTDQFYAVVSRLQGGDGEGCARRAFSHSAFSSWTRASVCSMAVV